MKKIFNVFALMSAIALLVTACTKDETLEPQKTPALDGSEIIFGSRAGFENNGQTRTVYSGEYYTVNGVTFERIDWVDGSDVVEIYSPEAGGQNPAHYVVMDASKADDADDATVDTKDEGYLVKTGDISLQWNGDGEHTFYAMYPSSEMASISVDNTLKQGIKMNQAVLTGVVPQAQKAIAIVEPTTTDPTYYAKPDMTYAYMAAKSTATRTQGAVSLDFVPVVTTLEVELVAQNVDVTIKELMVSGQGVAGSFTADLSNWATTTTYPTCTLHQNTAENPDVFAADQVIFSLGEAITLTQGQSLVFTVFLRPGVDYENVTVGFSETGAGYISKQIGNTAGKVQIKKHAKTVVRNVYLPKTEEELVIDASHWMDQLDDRMDMARLSLPGAGGAFTAAYSDTNYKQQTLGFEQLWTAGVRVFEVSTDRCGDSPADITAAASLGELNIMCNGENLTGIVLQDVVCDLIDKVSSGSETAMLILTYQPPGGSGSNNRNGGYYARNLRKFYNTLVGGTVTTDNGHVVSADDFVLYSPSLTLGGARGKVMLIARPIQSDETDNFGDEVTTWNAIDDAMEGVPVLMLRGAGTAKDRWGKRGYKVQGNTARDIVPYGASFNASTDVEYYLKQVSSGFFSYSWPDYAANVTKGDSDFTFSTDEVFNCWYQDWARVVDFEHLGVAAGSEYYQVSRTLQADYRWCESLAEKKADVEKTFSLALNSKPSDNVVYINSLCGYLVDSSISESYTPFPDDLYARGGSTGNIAALATIMNDYLNQIVTEAGLAQETGPTGVVMMDYVTSNSPAIGAIVANNFKFNF